MEMKPSEKRQGLQCESFGLSDIGKKRKNNEDAFAILDQPSFFALADGMGGHLAGEIASQIAIEHVCSYLIKSLKTTKLINSSVLLETLSTAMQNANHEVFQAARHNSHFEGMGTTLSCLMLNNNQLVLGHAGDSRIYLYRDQLEQLTEDHIIRLEGKKGKLTKAIGTSLLIEPEIKMIDICRGDLILLCSDGLSDCLNEQKIIAIIKKAGKTPQNLCTQLVEAANAAGGHDNITVVAINITSL